MKRIGIIGVGLLGSAVASRLLKRKFAVKGYDTRLKQVKALQPKGLMTARSIAEVAADADAVFTILPSLESVETTILSAGGLIEHLPPRATLIQMSTISPELARRLAKALAAKRLGFLDAPMSGTSAMVERGDCTIFVAGDRKRAAACRAVFDAIARAKKGRTRARTTVLRLRNGALGLGKISPEVPRPFVAEVERIRRLIAAGTIQVPATLN